MSVVCHPTPQCLSFHMDRNTVVQLLNYILLFVTSWIAAHQAFLSFTISWSLLKLMSIKLVMPSNHLILCRPLLLPSKSFPGSKSLPVSFLFPSRGQSIGDSASASVLSMNSQGWFSLGLTKENLSIANFPYVLFSLFTFFLIVGGPKKKKNSF